jgi:hypothetical protein
LDPSLELVLAPMFSSILLFCLIPEIRRHA